MDHDNNSSEWNIPCVTENRFHEHLSTRPFHTQSPETWTDSYKISRKIEQLEGMEEERLRMSTNQAFTKEGSDGGEEENDGEREGEEVEENSCSSS